MQIDNAKQVLDVFTIEEIQKITSALLKLKNSANSGDQFYAYTNGFRSNDLIYPLIKKIALDKLEYVLGQKIVLAQGMHLKETKPWLIHTDYIKDDEFPGMAILIPLNTELVDTHTVVFNEECTDSFDDYLKTHNKIQNNAAYMAAGLMSHETINRLEYVSLLGAYKWHPGSIICWDRKLLHSSDNFITRGITEKSALVLFTSQDLS